MMRGFRVQVLARWTWLCLLLACGLTSVGCVRGFAEEAVRRSLPHIIGPADRYVVKIENTPDGRLMAGDIEDLSVVGYHVTTKDGLIIARLAVTMHGLKIDTGKKQIKSVEKAVFDLDIAQDDLSRLAREKLHGIGNPQVLLSNNGVSLVLPAHLLKLSVDTTLRGALAVEEGQRILFVPDRLTIGILHVPDALVSAAVGRVNPVADLRTLPVPAQVDLMTIDKGILNVRGRLFATPATAAAPTPATAAAPTPDPSPPATSTDTAETPQASAPKSSSR